MKTINGNFPPAPPEPTPPQNGTPTPPPAPDWD